MFTATTNAEHPHTYKPTTQIHKSTVMMFSDNVNNVIVHRFTNELSVYYS